MLEFSDISLCVYSVAPYCVPYYPCVSLEQSGVMGTFRFICTRVYRLIVFTAYDSSPLGIFGRVDRALKFMVVSSQPEVFFKYDGMRTQFL